ncbi:MAG: acetyl-CoA carboxylase biotin carboxyl carrier protein [Armatimonadota bacterium]
MEHLREESLTPPIVDLDWIRQLVALVEREDLSELIISQGEVTVIVRGRSYRPANFFGIAPNTHFVTSSATLSGVGELETESLETIPDERLFHITAPLTGIFYSRPRPDAPPFVTVGSEVEPDQVVALVEAMKFFNEVRSEVRGIVREIVAKDGQLVKHGDTLIVLERLD